MPGEATGSSWWCDFHRKVAYLSYGGHRGPVMRGASLIFLADSCDGEDRVTFCAPAVTSDPQASALRWNETASFVLITGPRRLQSRSPSWSSPGSNLTPLGRLLLIAHHPGLTTEAA
jgi:hypothetical protein